jgi:phosphomannomutase
VRKADRGPADVGLALDADGDRLRLVDERGAEHDPECTLPLIALARGARSVVRSSDTSRMVDHVVGARGGWVRATGPGELHVLGALLDVGADLAGEGNGGVVVPEMALARDGLAAAVSVLELLALTGRPLSALLAELPRLERRRSIVPCPDPALAARLMAETAGRIGTEIDDPDAGVFVERAGGVWGLVRASATEPVIRVTVEAPSIRDADALHARLRATVLDSQASLA